ncbi:insulinase family protein [Altererythrobacter sp. SALINAS58]|uniref:M16 family metallopeptidase n=1 Tax=Alteripontixanthobacter muriae TaxID=2705546 RepID=UPI0015756B6D|nr:M16 family metallopeptidase [Alteripontixanthobacter muriae]NTZ41970.1 insulinase family protein [Alteripontixanthobacter muriae]
MAGASAAVLLVATPGLAQGPVEGWNVEATDVVPDASVIYGQLDNGMKYAIRQNDKPEGTAAIRMHVDFGSLAEADNERGLAHFIEHMAFNGTTNIPEGEMVKLLERKGLAFGADTNAYTGFDETVYMLDLPQTSDDLVDTGLMLMRETAGEILFDPAAVDRERGVIVGERRARDSFQLRQIMDQLRFTAPNTPYADRFPIGTDEVLTTAPAERLKALYNRYYRPENTTLIMVGDFDPAAIEAKIRAVFSDWQAEGAAGAPAPLGSVDMNRPAAFDTFIDPAAPSQVLIEIMRPYDDPADTVTERRAASLRSAATGLFDQRLSRLTSAADSNVLNAGIGLSEYEDAADTTTLRATTRDGAWQEGLELLETEARRAAKFGFTQRELDRYLANRETAYRTAVEQAEARTNAQIANDIVAIAAEDDFLTDPAWRYEFFQTYRGDLTLDAVNAQFRELLDGSAPVVHVAGKQIEGGEEAIQRAYLASLAEDVVPMDAADEVMFAYDDFGTPGTVVSDERIEDLDIRTVRFDNNVRLNIKKTDFEPGRVRFNVAMSGGQFILPEQNSGYALMLSTVGSNAATARNSEEDLKEVLAGRNVTTGFQPAVDAFVVGGATTPEDLELQMKVSAAYLTDAGFRPEAQSRYASLVDVISEQLNATPQNVAATQVPTIIANDDPRFGIPGREVLSALSLEDLRSLYLANAADAPIEIGIVGDIDEDAAIAAVAQSFGALPERMVQQPDFAAQRTARFREDLTPVVLTHGGQADQAMVNNYWPLPDDSDYRLETGISMLSSVMRLMLTEELRENLGATYGASVGASMSEDFTDFGYLAAGAVVDPAQMDVVEAAILEVARQLRDAPVDADLLTRARNPALEQQQQSLTDNGYWAAYVSSAQGEAERLDRIRQRRANLEAVTPAELQTLAQRYLDPAQRLSVRVVAEEVAAAAN